MALSMTRMFQREHAGASRSGFIPSNGANPKISITFPATLYSRLAGEAEKLDVSFATVVRLACRDWFDDEVIT